MESSFMTKYTDTVSGSNIEANLQKENLLFCFEFSLFPLPYLYFNFNLFYLNFIFQSIIHIRWKI